MELVFATNNPHKLEEVQNAIGPSLEVRSLRSIGCEHEIPETEDTLEANARIKAAHVFETHGHDAFSDDTGLEVEALNGRPGVHSARYAGEDPSFQDNIEKLLGEMKGVEERSARFRTVIALFCDGTEHYFEGSVEGRIAESPRGEGGFGYDPVFIPEGEERSFAEMTPGEKENLGHRGKAVRALAEFLASLRT